MDNPCCSLIIMTITFTDDDDDNHTDDDGSDDAFANEKDDDDDAGCLLGGEETQYLYLQLKKASLSNVRRLEDLRNPPGFSRWRIFGYHLLPQSGLLSKAKTIFNKNIEKNVKFKLT